jgi:hypothetical protein
VTAAGVRQFPFALQIWAGVITPPVQDWSAPQSVPAGALPADTQTGLPVVQEMVPGSLHGSLGVQVAPELQTTQFPAALHTRLVPQVVPLGAGPVAWQTAVPVWQL